MDSNGCDTLDYQTPAQPQDDGTGAIPALKLCAPGIACFALIPLGGVPLGLLLVAMVTAVISVVAYGRKPTHPKPWYELLNLAVNIPGLLLAAVCVFR